MKKYYGYIYKIVCKINNKIYIGQTIRTIKERWSSHKHDAKGKKTDMVISKAIRKYGEENFIISII